MAAKNVNVDEILPEETLSVQENLPGDGQTYPKDGDICTSSIAPPSFYSSTDAGS